MRRWFIIIVRSVGFVAQLAGIKSLLYHLSFK